VRDSVEAQKLAIRTASMRWHPVRGVLVPELELCFKLHLPSGCTHVNSQPTFSPPVRFAPATHPLLASVKDKVSQSLGEVLDPMDRSRIMHRVTATMAGINALRDKLFG